MQKEAIYFFQELFDHGIVQKESLDICKKSLEDLIKSKEIFFQYNLYLSERASYMNERFEKIAEKVNTARQPVECLVLEKELEEIHKTVRRYGLNALKYLQQSIFLPENIEVLPKPVEPYSKKRINELLSLLTYYITCQNGAESVKTVKSYGKAAEEKYGKNSWEYYLSVWMVLKQLAETEKISYWKYEQRICDFEILGKIPQFYFADPQDALHVEVPGNPRISYVQGELSIAGKGYITNLDPQQTNLFENFLDDMTLCTDKDLILSDEQIWELDFHKNPGNVLDLYFPGKSYCVSAEAYFRFANTCCVFQQTSLYFEKG